MNKFGSAARSQLRHFGIGTALETIGSFAAQAQSFGGAANGDRIEPRALDQDVARTETDFGFRAAHYAADTHGARRVRDHAHLFRKRSLGAIERADFFARLRAPHHDAPLRQLIQIERVQRLSQLEQHVVRHIHDVVDRILPDRFEPLPQPVRRRLHFYSAEHARGVSPAQFRRLDFDARRVGRLLARFL